MPRPLFDTPYIFGLHDPGGEQIMIDAGRPGWIAFTEAIGSDPTNTSGGNYTPWSERNLGIITRLNNGYEPEGTLPLSSQYPNFARRCANHVANSQGCKIWIIGNEPNLPTERPIFFGSRSVPRFPSIQTAQRQIRSRVDRNQQLQPVAVDTRSKLNSLRAFVDDREVITPALYADCFRQCRAAIKALPGHADDLVLIAAIAPWNNQTQYPSNEVGDWVKYMQDILTILGPGGLDGITIHAYTHGVDPALITLNSPMDPPFENRQFNFQVYRDWMNAIPANLRNLPVFISETDQIEAWADSNSGWVQAAYAEINAWNSQPANQRIRTLCLYRWPNFDQWGIESKSGVIEDFRTALTNNYVVSDDIGGGGGGDPIGAFKSGDIVRATGNINLRRSPGYIGKAFDDVATRIPTGASLTVLDSTSVRRDNLTWWNVRSAAGTQIVDGWVAQVAPQGTTLLVKIGETPPVVPATIAIGATIRTRAIVRLRLSPGYLGKPPSDVIRELPAGQTGVIISGPSTADSLTWWLTRLDNSASAGWVAERLPNGTRILEAITPAPPPPSAVSAFAIGDLIQSAGTARVRRTPGVNSKPSDDVLGGFYPKTTLNVIEGPRVVDGLTWWRVGGIMQTGDEVLGWVAQVAGTTTILRIATQLPGTTIADKTNGVYLAAPYQGKFGIAQLWGENPAVYSQIGYDGVPLLGHNGVDFLTPTGTPLLATDNGVASEVVANDPTGFGNYVKLQHSWGESVYAHMLDFSIGQGQGVSRGQLLGRSGATGNVTGPHLHFAIRINPYNRRDGWGGYSDPLPYMRPADFQLPFYVLSSQQRLLQRVLVGGKRVFLGAGYTADKAGVKRP